MSLMFVDGARRVLTSAVFMALLTATAFAADPPKKDKPAAQALVPAIMIVDLPQVLRDSKAGKSVQATLNQESQAYSKEVARQEDDLQKMRSDLERQRTVLAPEAFDAKAKAFQQHFQELDRAVQTRRQALQAAYNEAMLKVEKAALDIIGGIAKERGANLVLAKQATILQSEEADVTAEVLARLDKSLTTVPVNVPKGGDGEAAAKPVKEPKKN